MVIILWAIFCLFDATNGWQLYSTLSAPLVNDVPQELPSRELKTDNDIKLAKVLTDNNYFTELAPIKNGGSKELTNPTVTDNTYDYKKIALTTAITVFRKEIFNADFNITQKERTIDEPKKFDKKILNPLKNSEAGIHDRDFTRSKSESLDENQYRVHTPARRIFHGHKTKIKHFPFLVTVHVLSHFVCGGTIIKSDLVLTAAACLKRWQDWLRQQSTTQNTSTDVNVQSTIDTITTDVNAQWDGNANVTNKVDTTTAITTVTVTAKYASSEDSGRSSSYETAAPETCAHTVTNETPKPEPFAGVLSVRIGTNYYRLGGKIVHVNEAYFHPSYNEENLHNNLVIMRLERRLNFEGRRVRKIHIHPTAIDLSDNSAVTVAGWGAKTYHNRVFNVLWNLIHKTVMNVSPLDQCASTYNATFVTATNFCALNEHHEGACYRDVGNPAVADGKLVGVVSFGPPKCGAWDSPTVFTNISYYVEWINKIRSIKTVTNKYQTSSSSQENSSSENPTPETTTELTTYKDLT